MHVIWTRRTENPSVFSRSVLPSHKGSPGLGLWPNHIRWLHEMELENDPSIICEYFRYCFFFDENQLEKQTLLKKMSKITSLQMKNILYKLLRILTIHQLHCAHYTFCSAKLLKVGNVY